MTLACRAPPGESRDDDGEACVYSFAELSPFAHYAPGGGRRVGWLNTVMRLLSSAIGGGGPHSLVILGSMDFLGCDAECHRNGQARTVETPRGSSYCPRQNQGVIYRGMTLSCP